MTKTLLPQQHFCFIKPTNQQPQAKNVMQFYSNFFHKTHRRFLQNPAAKKNYSWLLLVCHITVIEATVSRVLAESYFSSPGTESIESAVVALTCPQKCPPRVLEDGSFLQEATNGEIVRSKCKNRFFSPRLADANTKLYFAKNMCLLVTGSGLPSAPVYTGLYQLEPP